VGERRTPALHAIIPVAIPGDQRSLRFVFDAQEKIRYPSHQTIGTASPDAEKKDEAEEGEMRRYAIPGLVTALLVLAATGCGSAPAPTPTTKPPPPTVPPPTATKKPPEPTPVPPSPTPVPPEATAEPPPSIPEPVLAITSSAFQHEGDIPIQYTCFGQNISPALEWSGVPDGAQSLALLVDDPDSVPPGFVHWVIFNIPPAATGLPEDVPAGPTLPDGSRQGSNAFAPYGAGTFPGGAAIKLVGYDGPCPGGQHRYAFTLYALDTLLDVPAEATGAQVVEAMQGHVLAQAQLVGLFTPPQ